MPRTFMDRLRARQELQAAHRKLVPSNDRTIESSVQYHKPVEPGLLCEERVMGLTGDRDSICNNTDCVIRLETVGGALVQILEPGRVFAPEESITVRIRSNQNLVHRSYFNERV